MTEAALRSRVEAGLDLQDLQDSQAINPLDFAPEPLRRPLPPAKPFPVNALGEVLGPATKSLHHVIQAPLALCAQSILAAASLAAQPHADVLIDGRREPLSLWHITIGDSGERKSAVDGWALREHRQFERERVTQYEAEKAAYSRDLKAHESAERNCLKGKDAAANKAALKSLDAAPTPPLFPYLLVNEPTLEGLHKLYVNGDPSIGLFSDDAAEFLGGHAMNKDNKAKSAAGMSRLWDAGEFSRVRSGDGAAKFYGKRLSLHLMLQPVIAESLLSDDVLTGQGFLARCLLSWPQSSIGGRLYVEGNLSDDQAMQKYWTRARSLLEQERRHRENAANELEPRTLTLTPDAKRLWIELHNSIEQDMTEGCEFAPVKAWASKAAGQLLRIAGILTLFRDPHAEAIQKPEIEAASALVLHYLREAVRIVGTHSVPPEVRNAEALLAWAQTRVKRLIHSSAAMTLGPACIRSQHTFRAAMTELERTGWATKIEGGMKLDGKPRKHVWKVREVKP